MGTGCAAQCHLTVAETGDSPARQLRDSDSRDIRRGALSLLGGFGGRLVARVGVVALAGRIFGIEAFGQLGEVAALIECAAALGMLGFRRSVFPLIARTSPAQGAATALLGAAAGSLVLVLVLGMLWPLLFPAVPRLVLVALPALVLGDVALAITRHQRSMRWEVLARSLGEPWGLLLLLLLAWALAPSATGLLAAYAGSMLISGLIALYGLHRTIGLPAIMRARLRLPELTRALMASLPTALVDLSIVMYRRVDILLLGLVAGPKATGLYYMAQQLATLVQKIHQLFEPVIAPVVAQAFSSGRSGDAGYHLQRGCTRVLGLQLTMMAILYLAGGAILETLGTGFGLAWTALMIILVGEVMDGSTALIDLPFIYQRPGITPLLAAPALLVEVIAVPVLASRYGIEGAAAGFALAMTVLALLRLVTMRRLFAVQLWDRGR